MSENSISELVIYNNNQLIAANKPSGIPSQPDTTGDKSLQGLMEIYCKHPVYLVHRLDRPASGVMLFAKNKDAVANLHKQFLEHKVQKTYYAIVGHLPETTEGPIEHYLRFNTRKNKAFVCSPEEGKLAQLSYEWVTSSDRYHLLRIKLITGRQHQIRAQLAAIGSPIRGDDKYGFKRGNQDRSIDLHAHTLEFAHPVNDNIEKITAPFPDTPLWNAFLKHIEA
jgi:23S rRNA pseudouridine1911/1915/1917 synthase